MTTSTAMPMHMPMPMDPLTSRPPPPGTDQTTPPAPLPPPLISKPKPLSFSNGSLKRHHQPPPPPAPRPLYRECLKNHAAALGAHAVDGCGEFMPSPHSNPSDPTSLKCAACGCHRNFHRRDDDDDDDDGDGENENNDVDDTGYLPHPIHFPAKRHNSHSPPPYLSSSAPHMLLALSTGFSGPTDAFHHPYPTTPGTNRSSSSSGPQKRFRSKFSKEQKERMQGFSEKLGWRMQKQDEEAVEEFCREIGVSKGVFKVWMHNNKNSFVKRDQISSSSSLLRNNNDNNIVISRDNHVTNTTSVITSNSNVDMTSTDYNDASTRSTNAHLPTNASSSSS